MGENPVTSPWKGWNVNATPAPTLFEDVMSQVKKKNGLKGRQESSEL